MAATGCLKTMTTGAHNQQQLQSGYYKNMYTSGTVKMTCCETEVSSIQGESVTNSGGGRPHETDHVDGCFVLWQMLPGMWSLELVLSSGNKVLAGSDGDTVWSHSPSRGNQIAKGPKRPLRRIIQVSICTSLCYIIEIIAKNMQVPSLDANKQFLYYNIYIISACWSCVTTNSLTSMKQ